MTIDERPKRRVFLAPRSGGQRKLSQLARCIDYHKRMISMTCSCLSRLGLVWSGLEQTSQPTCVVIAASHSALPEDTEEEETAPSKKEIPQLYSDNNITGDSDNNEGTHLRNRVHTVRTYVQYSSTFACRKVVRHVGPTNNGLLSLPNACICERFSRRTLRSRRLQNQPPPSTPSPREGHLSTYTG